LKGGIYFTDPYYQRPYWDRTTPDIKGEKVYYLAKGKKQAVVVATIWNSPMELSALPMENFSL
jgi:gluconolactonase